MIVSELIEELKKCPPDWQVMHEVYAVGPALVKDVVIYNETDTYSPKTVWIE